MVLFSEWIIANGIILRVNHCQWYYSQKDNNFWVLYLSVILHNREFVSWESWNISVSDIKNKKSFASPLDIYINRSLNQLSTLNCIVTNYWHIIILSFTTDFYGKGAAYNQLAGRDASYAIATWSLEDKDMHHDLVSICIS